MGGVLHTVKRCKSASTHALVCSSIASPFPSLLQARAMRDSSAHKLLWTASW